MGRILTRANSRLLKISPRAAVPFPVRSPFGFASFRGRILALFVGLIAIAQVSTLVAVLAATRRNVAEQQRDALELGGRVVEQLLRAREARLRDAAQLLVSDAAFREAVATGDAAGIDAALASHRERADAGVVALLAFDGRVVARAAQAQGAMVPGESAPEPIRELLRRAEREGAASAAAVLAGRPYQLVLLPIEAPLRIAWLGMGFELDDALAGELERVTALDVSFVSAEPGAAPALFASTLGERERARLRDALARRGGVALETAPFLLPATQQLTFSLGLGGARTPELAAVLQSSLALALAPWQAVGAQQVALATLALALSVLAAFTLARRITQPVDALVAGARRILGGSYETPVQVSARDELGLLARTFNEMQRSIAERENRIVHQAHHDALTGLPNRAIAGHRIGMAIARARSRRGELALLALDLRGLKAVNDAFGHSAGDRVLIEQARRLREAAADAPLVARLGSDEFLVLLEGRREEVEAAARRLLLAVRVPVAIDDASVEIGIHGGLALCPAHGDDADTLLRRADVALQDAKALRKDLVVYEVGRDERHLRQLALIRDLRQAIADGAIGIHYQPKVDLLTGDLHQAEALARWTHPERGAIPPDEFIPLAERAGLIFDVTRLVLAGVARQWRAWTDRGLQLGLSVNLSPHDLARPELPDVVHGVLAAYAMPPQALIFELTESAVMEDPAGAVRVLENLRCAGLRIAIDDFGTGHSSLAQLKRMPVDELKIDKSFVRGLEKTSEDAAIVRSIVDLGHHLGLQVVAEGVEDAAAWNFLAAHRCDMVQGYYVSRPLPAPDFERFVRDYAERER
jgi:diguanylate cyclase (GGDEF)-like protein